MVPAIVSSEQLAVLLAHPLLRVVDLETTGLSDEARIVEITILDGTGAVIYTSLVQPGCSIPADVQAIHGISDADVSAAPRWEVVWPTVRSLLTNAIVVAYSAAFDARMLTQEVTRIGGTLPAMHWCCAMHTFLTLTQRREARIRLAAACAILNIPLSQTHRALVDAQATWLVLQKLAADQHAKGYDSGITGIVL